MPSFSSCNHHYDGPAQGCTVIVAVASRNAERVNVKAPDDQFGVALRGAQDLDDPRLALEATEV
jgi:hypothetical protein